MLRRHADANFEIPRPAHLEQDRAQLDSFGPGSQHEKDFVHIARF